MNKNDDTNEDSADENLIQENANDTSEDDILKEVTGTFLITGDKRHDDNPREETVTDSSPGDNLKILSVTNDLNPGETYPKKSMKPSNNYFSKVDQNYNKDCQKETNDQND